uniref:Clustered mitochondria protein homolog n=1 Tax=Rhizophora mucronata TaxID=61149 RepID=A0A2P2IHW0_RHIMU
MLLKKEECRWCQKRNIQQNEIDDMSKTFSLRYIQVKDE